MADLKSYDPTAWKEVSATDAWVPQKEGDSIMGVLVSVELKAGKFGNSLFTIETAPGKRRNLWGSAMLQPRMEKVKVGEHVKVEFTGEIVTKNGRAKNYKVYTQQQE